MKFKVIESNDYDYDAKDKNFYYSWDWSILKRKVAKNPNNITFNPLEVEFQKLREYWLWERRDKMIARMALVWVIVAIGIIVYGLYTGDIYV